MVIDELTNQLAKHVSDLGNQHNNGPHQDQIVDNLSALCFALWAWKIGFGSWRGWELMHPISFLWSM